jgi:three-Cys-motif partner protein
MGSDANQQPIEPHDDGLLIPEVGRWSKRKYHFLGRYFRQFTGGMKNKWPHRHYVDLFSGAGFARIRDSGEIVAGSPVLAANCVNQFTGLHLCEADAAKTKALQVRLGSVATRCSFFCADANECIDRVLADVPKSGSLSVTLADPFGLHLDFDTIRRVAERRSDLIVLLADNMDAARNWAEYYFDNPDSNLDRFMGERGWRDVLAQGASDAAGKIRARYIERLKSKCGYTYTDSESIRNDQGRDIYSLIFASKDPLGLKFWNDARRVDETGQRSLFGGP